MQAVGWPKVLSRKSTGSPIFRSWTSVILWWCRQYKAQSLWPPSWISQEARNLHLCQQRYQLWASRNLWIREKASKAVDLWNNWRWKDRKHWPWKACQLVSQTNPSQAGQLQEYRGRYQNVEPDGKIGEFDRRQDEKGRCWYVWKLLSR